jgi:hypothetical protein
VKTVVLLLFVVIAIASGLNVKSTASTSKLEEIARSDTSFYVDSIEWKAGSTSYRAISMVTQDIAGTNEILTLTVYETNNTRVQLIQRFDSLECLSFPGKLLTEDLNFDGVKDFKVSMRTGARGGNEWFYLFLCNPTTQRFTMVTALDGSTTFVNAVSDSVDKMIHTLGLSGSTNIERLKFQNDTLRPVDGKEVWAGDSMVYQRKYIYRQNGEEQTVSTDSCADGDFIFGCD